MRIVIISDIHGNFAALQAPEECWDELWVIGDLVNYGPEPKEVVAWAQEHAHVVIRGNHNHAVGFATDPRCSPPYKTIAAETGAFSSSVLNHDEKTYLERLPLSVDRRLGRQTFHLCHATPSNPLFGYKDTDDATWQAEVESTSADVVIVGHTHVPFVHRFETQRIMNPGSIGQPKTGTPEACYGVWEDGRLELKRYFYPLAQAEAEIRDLPISQGVKDDLIFALKTGGKLRRGGQ
jgi:putative phosphoesterase